MSIANTHTETIIEAGIIDDSDQVQARVEHLKELENLIGNSYPNKYDRSNITGAEDTISNILNFAPVAEIVKELKENTPEGEKPNQELKGKLNEKLKAFGNVRVSGRLAVPPRVMGKAAFVHLSDGVGRLQIYCRKDDFSFLKTDAFADSSDALNSADSWTAFGLLDHGDFIGASGYLFLTNTGELSVHVETIRFLAKALLPMPDKMHGIADPEIKRRYRYADLIASSLQVEHEGLTTREVFERRAKLISGMRNYLDAHGYIEVETPMLTPKATGAAAKPFQTHHNALDIPLYARIAPELYLKRLVVGGFEKVYELNRNFRNEGLSHKHNPEFTMLEFYCAYMDVNGMMDFAEAMIKESVQKATGGSLQVKYGENEIDFSKFERWTMKKAIADNWKNHLRQLGEDFFDINWLDDSAKLLRLRAFLLMLQNEVIDIQSQNITAYRPENISTDERSQKLTEYTIEIEKLRKEEIWQKSGKFIESLSDTSKVEQVGISEKDYHSLKNLFSSDTSQENQTARVIEELFENLAEENLIQPTFIIDYPKSISPLSKASPENPNIAERFELFVNGMECANGFSELNDPQEQYERFDEQRKQREKGDEEAMVLDEDYIRALAYGMPPAAGIGIGIDRLVMLLTNKHSIRDVILFPHLRPEKNTQNEPEAEV